MAAHDAAEFIGPAIASVLRQTYPSVELVIVDDASTDGTVDVVSGYVATAPERIRLVRLTENSGPCHARNIALAHASGELICWLDDDDLWEESKVERQVSLLLDRDEFGLVYTYFDAFDSDTGSVLRWPDGRRDIEGDILGSLFVVGCFIGSLTVMFRRTALETRAFRLREREFSFGDDYYLWLTIALDWQVARIPEVLARYRRHAGNESTRISRENVHLQRLALMEEFLDEFPDARERLGRRRREAFALVLSLAADFEGHRGRGGAANRLWLRAFREDPLLALRRRLRRSLPSR